MGMSYHRYNIPDLVLNVNKGMTFKIGVNGQWTMADDCNLKMIATLLKDTDLFIEYIQVWNVH